MLSQLFNGSKTRLNGRTSPRRPAPARRPLVDQLERRDLLALMMVNSPKVNLTDGTTPAPAVFTVSLNAPSSVPVTVNYQTVDATAKAGTDYVAEQGSVTFPAGATSETVSVPVMGQTTKQLTKAFNLRLSNAVNATLISSNGVGSIVDVTATTATLSINNPRLVQNTSGTQTMNFTVTLSTPVTNKAVSVSAATMDASAKAGVNYQANSSVLTFAPGQTTATFSVTIFDTPQVTSSLAFFVTLSGANVPIKTASGLGVIMPVGSTG